MRSFVRCLAVAVAIPVLANAQGGPPELEPPPPEMSSMSGEPLQPWIEYEQRMNQEQRLTAYGPDLLGDSIDPNTGQISFEHTDVVLPGNSKLDVSVRRRVSQGYLYAEGVNVEFGNWQYAVPRIVAISRTAGWTGNRCTQSLGTSFPQIPMTGSNPVQYLQNWEYSNGIQVEIPGQAAQQMLKGSPAHFGAGTTWTTAENWRFTCGITAKNSANQNSGEGFIGYAPDGTRYEFDRYIKHDFRPLGALMSAKTYGTPRAKSILAARKVTDVNGNTVTYTYDSSDRLTKIESNDGRRIDFIYQGTSKLVYQVRTNPTSGDARTWTYFYRATAQSKPYWEGGGAINKQLLHTVTQPDGKFWDLDLDGLYAEPTPGECWTEPLPLVVTHPYGTVGTFWLTEQRHRYGLNDVMQQMFDCPSGEPEPPPPQNPNWVTMLTDTMSVESKRLEGPGVPAATWTFDYETDLGPPGTSGADPTNWTKVNQPDGSQITYYHRWQYGALGGMLFRKEIRNSPAAEPLEVTWHTDPVTLAPSYIIEGLTGSTFAVTGSSVGIQKMRPDLVVIRRHEGTSQFDSYTTDYDYDSNFSSVNYSFGHATQVTATSSTAPGVARVTRNTYLHDKSLWIVGLPQKVERQDDFGVFKEFDFYVYEEPPLKRRLKEHKRFGVTKVTYAYNADGTIATIKDALNNTWALADWKRGKPRLVTRPDATTLQRTVDDNGWVKSETNSLNFTTSFEYNPMGWLTVVNRPLAHADTSILYSPSLPITAVQTRGTQRTTVSYDAMLRATEVKRDSTNNSVDAVFERVTYDIDGRAVFKSRPFFDLMPVHGINTDYDALGRVTKVSDSVSPTTVKTETEYLLDGITRVTDPAGAVTTTKSRSFGSPGNPEVMNVTDAMQGLTVTTRDIFGNVATLTQSGTQYGHAASATREFWYDDSLRLCRHRAPEFGDELFEYYDNDKLRYSSRGETPATGCAPTSASLRTELGYDTRGRPTTTNFPSTTPDITVGYDAESNRTSVTRDTIVWTYDYNAIDQPLFEQLVVDGRTYRFDYGYNANDHLSTRTRAGAVVSYEPDAFGRPTKIAAGGVDYVHSVSYLENGLVASGTFDNGQVFTQTLDAFQRPYELTVAKSGGPTAVSRTHLYDVRSQLETLTDSAVPADSRSFDYDPKGRLMTATGPWGAGSFEYDALDNLREQTLGTRVIAVNYGDATNRVTSATDAGVPRAYGYDTRGNATTVAGMAFTYDFSNQPTAVSGTTSASYLYDGNLKRVKSVAGGKTVYWIYPAVGGISLQDNLTDAKLTEYLAIGPLAVRLVNGATPEYTHGDHLGSPIAATDAAGNVSWRESYNPFGEARIKPAANASNTGYTGHVQDDDSGLTYMQARYYDPVIGRFLSTDPIGYQDQINQYAYVGNDPVNKTDPTGTLTQAGEGRFPDVDGCLFCIKDLSKPRDPRDDRKRLGASTSEGKKGGNKKGTKSNEFRKKFRVYSPVTDENGYLVREWLPVSDVEWRKNELWSAALSAAWDVGLQGNGKLLEAIGKIGWEVQDGMQEFGLFGRYDVMEQEFSTATDPPTPVLGGLTFTGYQVWRLVADSPKIELRVDRRVCASECPP
jgi:RHS repeat-associated protein